MVAQFYCLFTSIGTEQLLESLNPLTVAIGRPFFGHKSPAARARQLFKPAVDSASLLVDIKKKIFRFRWGFSGGDITMRTCFGNFVHLWPALGPNPLTHSIGSKFF